jgi:hypothetical protein
VTDVAVVLFDRDSQVFAGEKLIVRDEAVIALPIIGDARLAFADFVEEPLARGSSRRPRNQAMVRRAIGS